MLNQNPHSIVIDAKNPELLQNMAGVLLVQLLACKGKEYLLFQIKGKENTFRLHGEPEFIKQCLDEYSNLLGVMQKVLIDTFIDMILSNHLVVDPLYPCRTALCPSGYTPPPQARHTTRIDPVLVP